MRIIDLTKNRNFTELKTLNKELTEDQRLGLALIYNNFLYLEQQGKEKQFNISLYEIVRITSHLKRRRIILGSHKEHSII